MFRLVFVLVFWGCFANAQKDTIINGIILSDSKVLDEIHILNKTQGNGTLSKNNGHFTIKAKENDTLFFSAIHLEPYKHIVKKEDFIQLKVTLKTLTNQLKEVEIKEYGNINAQALGITNNVNKDTPAERKLKAAGKFKWYSPLLIPIGGMSVDGLINKISGRTSMLEKELLVEKKELAMSDLLFYYTDEFIEKNFKILPENAYAFRYILIDDADFVNALKNKNHILMDFRATILATDFKALQQENLPIKE